ncbi:hypothetical protein D3C75_1108700 [compost metagenome]
MAKFGVGSIPLYSADSVVNNCRQDSVSAKISCATTPNIAPVPVNSRKRIGASRASSRGAACACSKRLTACRSSNTA